MDKNGAKRVNFHVIFSNDVNPSDIQNEFLSQIHFFDTQNSKKSLSRANIEKVGQQIKQ